MRWQRSRARLGEVVLATAAALACASSSGCSAATTIRLLEPAAGTDAAIGDIQAPRAVIGNDTAEFRIQVTTGRNGAGAGNVALVIGDQRVASMPLQALAAFGDRTVTARARVPREPTARGISASRSA